MRSLQRRKQDIWITKASRSDDSIEGRTFYSKPIKVSASVSNTSGTPHELPVGIVAEYSRYFILFDTTINIEEGMCLFVDKTPQLNFSGYLETDYNGNPYTKPDYVVSHIMRTKKGTIFRYGIRKIAGDE